MYGLTRAGGGSVEFVDEANGGSVTFGPGPADYFVQQYPRRVPNGTVEMAMELQAQRGENLCSGGSRSVSPD